MNQRELHRWTRRLPEGEIDFLVHVLPERRIIYVTNPKVASSTMKSTLWRWHLQDPDYVFGRNEVHNKNKSPFRSPKDFGFGEFMSNINSPEYFRMCFSRNPYTRLLSFYLEKILDKKDSRLMRKLGFSRTDTVAFPALVEAIASETWYEANRHYRAQTENLLWGDIHYDFVGHFESFADELDRLAVDHDIDLRSYLSVRQRHATQADRHLHRYYSDEVQARVHELYRPDFEAFGYDHDLPDFSAGEERPRAARLNRTDACRELQRRAPEDSTVEDGTRGDALDAGTARAPLAPRVRIAGERDGGASDTFPTLDTDLGQGLHDRPEEGRKRICIATSSIGGPVEREGSGIAHHHLARLLAQWGHDVVIGYVSDHAGDAKLMEQTRGFYAGLGVALEPIAPRSAVKTELTQVLAPTWALLDWLRTRDRPFDIVHLSERRGLGYGPLLAKSLGIDFGGTHFVVHGHGPTLWEVEGNYQLLSDQRELGWVFMERRSVELADTATCASAPLLAWMRNAGYVLSSRTFVWPHPCPAPAPSPSSQADRAAREGAELEEAVFFGRLESRKGLGLFIEAMNRLVRQGRAPANVTFLGGTSSRMNGPRLIRRSANKWPIRVRMITNYRNEEAIAYLSQPGRLAVLCSWQENSLLAVTECLQAGLPFVATATGGTQRLVAPDDRVRAIVAPDHVALGDRIAELAGEPLRAVRPGWSVERSLDVWSRWHGQDTPFEAAAARFAHKAHAAGAERPLVTVCIVHHERPDLLRMAVDSVLLQDYPSLEAVLVDDGSEDDESLAALDAIEAEFAERAWRVIREENRHAGAARNIAAAAAQGEWLLFLDDDNVLFPDAVSRLVRAARFCGADAVSAAAVRFTGDGDPRTDTAAHGNPIRYLGAARAWNRFRNVAGDTCALVRREAFAAVGGFPEDYGLWLQDMCLFNRLLQAGHRTEPMPDPVFYYRHSPGSGSGVAKRLDNSADAAAVRLLSPYLAGLPDEERAFAAYTISATRQDVHPVLAKQLDAARHDLVEYERQLVDRDKRLAESDKRLVECDKQLAERDKQLAERDKQLAERDKQLAKRERRLGSLTHDLEIARGGHVMALALRGGSFGLGRLTVDLVLNSQLPNPAERSRDGANPVLELRCNGRRVAHASERDLSRNLVRIEAKPPLAAIGDVLYSIHDTASAVTLAAIVRPALRRARRVVGAVENRERPQIQGWIFDPTHPERRRRVAIHVDGRLCEVVRADRPRDDIANWKCTDGRHGFLWSIPEAVAAMDGVHIEVFDADTGRPLQGSPLHLTGGQVTATGRRAT